MSNVLGFTDFRNVVFKIFIFLHICLFKCALSIVYDRLNVAFYLRNLFNSCRRLHFLNQISMLKGFIVHLNNFTIQFFLLNFNRLDIIFHFLHFSVGIELTFYWWFSSILLLLFWCLLCYIFTIWKSYGKGFCCKVITCDYK